MSQHDVTCLRCSAGFNVIFGIHNKVYEEEPNFVSLRDSLDANSISTSSRAKLWEFCFPLYDRPDRDKFVCSSPSDFRIPGKSNCILSN